MNSSWIDWGPGDNLNKTTGAGRQSRSCKSAGAEERLNSKSSLGRVKDSGNVQQEKLMSPFHWTQSNIRRQ